MRGLVATVPTGAQVGKTRRDPMKLMITAIGAVVAGGLAAGLLLLLAARAGASIAAPVCAPAGETFGPGFRLAVIGDTVTLEACDAEIQTVLRSLAARTGTALVFHRAASGRVTVQLKAVSLETAVARILRDRSFLLVRRQSGGNLPAAMRRQMLWVFSGPDDRLPVYSKAGVLAPSHALPIDSRAGAQSHAPNRSGDELRERVAAVRRARASGGREALDALIYALGDVAPGVRQAAVHGLADVGGDRAVEALTMALLDSDTSVRVEAAHALGGIGTGSAVSVLSLALTDPKVAVRQAAIQALADRPGDAGVDLLALALRDENPRLRRVAVESLDMLGSPGAREVLGVALDDPDAGVVAAARDGLTGAVAH